MSIASRSFANASNASSAKTFVTFFANTTKRNSLPARVSFVRVAGLEMHPLDGLNRAGLLKDQLGLGYCNITKCCTEVCPEEIRITDNAHHPR